MPPTALFRSGLGVPLQLTAKGKAYGQNMFQDKEIPATATQAVPSDSSEASKAVAQEKKLPPAASGFTNGMGKACSLTVKGQAKAKEMFQSLVPEEEASMQAELTAEGNSWCVPIMQQPSLASGFTLGTGQPIQVTAKGQAYADRMFLDDDPAAQTDAGTESAARGKAAEVSQGSGPRDRTAEAPAAAPVASGLSLGNGKPVQVSAKAQAKTRNLFQNENSAATPGALQGNSPTDTYAEAPAAAPVASGFSLGNGKPVQVSAKARAHAKNLFQNENNAATPGALQGNNPMDTSDEAPAAAPVASGFSLGNGKPVQVSAKAQAQARNLFQNESGVPTPARPQGNSPMRTSAEAPAPAPVASGFSLGNGKPVQVSAKAQANARNLFQNENNAATPGALQGSSPADTHAEAPAPAPVASGFSLGNGKPVQVSAKAQAQARNLFQNENDAPTPARSAHANTPAAVQKPEVKLTAGRLATPRTGSAGAKPVLKRGMTTVGGSSGGTQFKKLRTSRLMTPSALGATPNRVKPS